MYNIYSIQLKIMEGKEHFYDSKGRTEYRSITLKYSDDLPQNCIRFWSKSTWWLSSAAVQMMLIWRSSLAIPVLNLLFNPYVMNLQVCVFVLPFDAEPMIEGISIIMSLSLIMRLIGGSCFDSLSRNIYSDNHSATVGLKFLIEIKGATLF